MRTAAPLGLLARVRPLAVALVLGLAGCAAPGSGQLYVPLASGAGYGYSEKMLPDRQAVVIYDSPLDTAFSFQGSSGRRAIDAQVARAHDLALLRAADLALAKGYAAFRVTDRTNDVNVRRIYDPYDYDYGYPYYRRYGYPFYGLPRFPYGDSYETLYVQVTLDITFEPKVARGLYNAAEVRTTLAARYAVKMPG